MCDYWSYCGEIADLDLMRFPDSGRFRGIAFITFATVRCLALSAALLMCVQAASLSSSWGRYVAAAC